MKKLLFTSFVIIVIFTGSYNKLFSQCTNCGTQYPSTTQTTTSATLTSIATCFYGGDYAVCSVTAGKTYEWTTCGDTDFDTQLTLFGNTTCTGASLAFNDDACGTQSTITWTATFTGNVAILVSMYDCVDSGVLDGCMTLQWRCTDCSGSSVATAGDCTSAIDVCTNLGFQIDANGVGSTNEIPALGTVGNPSNNNPGGSGNMGCLRVGEKNSTWMIVNVATTGNLEFNFGGSSQAGFYDWIMYPYTQTSCNDIPNGLVAPVRCNWNGSSTGGTGLAATVPAGGSASNFEPPLPVTCGDKYIICFSNYSSSLTNVPLQFSGTATVSCNDLTCAGNAACSNTPGNPVYQNCIGAIPVCQNYFCQESSFSGVGSITNEINTSLSCLSSGEKNDSWYTFTVQQSGNLSFLITPNTITNDYDWAVYNLTNANCSQIATNSALQVSCNFSSTSGSTGPNGGSTSNSQGAGGTRYNAVIPVTTGQTYVINVSNYSSSQAGYTLDFSASTAVIFDNVPPQFSQITSTPACGSTSLNIKFSEQILCSSVQACDFTITGPGGPYTVTSVSGAACTAGGTQEQNFTLNFSPALSGSGSYSVNLVAGCGYVQDLCGNLAPAASLPFSISSVTLTTSKNNPSCFGSANGSATVTASGGSGYTYSWSPGGQTTATATGLAAGTYYVTVNSSGGCSTSTSVILVNPPALALSANSTSATCGASNGSITLNVSQGTPNYSYSCTGQVNATNQSSPYTFNNLAQGDYYLSVTDSKGCTASAFASVASTGSVTSTFTYPSNQCLTGNSFTFTNTGTAPGAGITYLWTFPSATPASSSSNNPIGVTWPTDGIYTVTQSVTQGSCTSTSTMNITVYPQPIPNVTATNITCNGSANGSASSSPVGGSGFTYNWSNGQITSSLTNLSPGTYTVTVKNADNCQATQTVTISQPPQITLVATRTDVTCFGLANGTASVKGTGGVRPYTFTWSGGTVSSTTDSTSAVSGLSTGTYTVTVSSAGNPSCFATATVIVNQPSDMILTITTTPAACGQAIGSATVTGVTNGTAPFSYLWSGGTTPTQSSTGGLSASSYTVQVTDFYGCTKTGTANVPSVGGPTVTISNSVNVTCNGAANGTATASGSGGTGALTYLWASGVAPFNQPAINGLGPGIHTVSVTDANNCVSTANVTITQPAAINIVTVPISSHCGLADGSATAVTSGGTTPYTSFQWFSDASFTNLIGTGSGLNNVASGTYYIKVTDSKSCTGTASVTIQDITGVVANVKSTTPALCNGDCNGTVYIETTGGISPFNYSLSNNAFTGSTAQGFLTIPNLCAGSYTVTVTDLNNCISIDTFSVAQPQPITASISSKTNVTCFGAANGSATAIATGGNTAYTYSWSVIPAQNTASATNLQPGTYTVTVSDANSCNDTAKVIITEPTQIVLTTSKQNAHCGNSDGSASVSANGGTITSGYSYLWSGGTAPLNLATISGLSSAGGVYTVTVTDNNNCQTTATVSVSDIPGGNASITNKSNVTCYSLCNGSASVSIAGGQAPYTYTWNTNPVSSTQNVTNLCPGTYTVTVNDFNNCTDTAIVIITQPAEITNTFSKTDASCNGVCDGALTANITGGTIPYSYQWNNFQTTQTVSSLCAVSYTVSVTDINGCQKSFTTGISQPSQINIIQDSVISTDCGQANGAIYCSVNGGSSPYTYQWSNNQTSQDLTNIVAGSYTVTVKDANNCTKTKNFIVSNNAGPIATITNFKNVTCNGLNNGFATVSATGGSQQYGYLWSTLPTGQLTSTATNLGPGTYSVTVFDSQTNCSSSASVSISEPPVISLFITSADAKCNGQCDGTASVAVTGGTAPYTYLWTGTSFTSNNSSVNGLCSGNYTVLVRDSNLCAKSNQVIINQPTFVTAISSSTALNCNGICDGTATVTPGGGTPNYTYQWSTNANSQTSQTAAGLCAGNYSVTVKDANNCQTTSNVNVASPTQMNITATLQHVKCFGQSSGRITLNVSGGTPGYTFLWSNNSTSQNQINIPYGTYSVTVTDNNNCTKDTFFIISQTPQLLVSLTSHDESCYGSCDGYINTNVQGGQQPYSYYWSNFTTQANATSLCENIYSVTVSDFNNCIATSFDTISRPNLLDVLVVSTTKATCDSANGTASISVIGGTWNYTYEWPAGVNSNSLYADGLFAGAYTVTVTDDNNCRDSIQVNISNHNAPQILGFTPVHVTCNGLQNGSLTVNYTPQNSTDIFTWTPISQSTQTATGLAAGTYSVQIKDTANCIVSASYTITQPATLQSSVPNHNDATCYGRCNGSASVSVIGGTAPYSYNWSSGSNSSTASSLCGNTGYYVTVTDNKLCTASSFVSIDQPDSVHIGYTINNPSCYGYNNGSVVLNVTGGNGFSYTWFPVNLGTSSFAANLSQGTYSVIVSDIADASCIKTSNFTLVQPDSMTINLASDPTHCGQNNGKAYFSSPVFGGTAPFTYQWTPGGSSNDTVYNAASGNYIVQVKDSHNCTSTKSVMVGSVQPPQLKGITTEAVSCPGNNDGSASISIKYGTAPFSYSWAPFAGYDSILNNDSHNVIIQGLNSGHYTVTVTDNNGCSVLTAFDILQPDTLTIHADGSRWICIGQFATISASASGGTPPYQFNWLNLPIPYYQVQNVHPETTTIYKVIVTDSRNCQSAGSASVIISVYDSVNVSLSAIPDRICSDTITTLIATPNGGNGGPYTFLWTRPGLTDTTTSSASITIRPDDTLTYSVKANDNCASPSIPDSVTVIVKPLPLVKIVPDKFAGCEPLEITFKTEPEVSTNSYVWNFGDMRNNTSLDSRPSHIFDSDGNYTVSLTVISKDTCHNTFSQPVVVHPNPNANFDPYPKVTGLFHSNIEFENLSNGNISSNYWTFGDHYTSILENPNHSYQQPGIYNVLLEVKTDKGCIDSITKKVEIRSEFTIYLPTAFDPTSPISREFFPQGTGIDYNNYHLWIYDRWGELIFETTDFFEKWTGKINNKGEFVKGGTYVWYINVKDTYGKAYEKTGYVTVIR